MLKQMKLSFGLLFLTFVNKLINLFFWNRNLKQEFLMLTYYYDKYIGFNVFVREDLI